MWNVDCTDTLVWVCWYKIRLSASDRLKCDMCICLSGVDCMGILDFKCKRSNNLSKKSTTDLYLAFKCKSSNNLSKKSTTDLCNEYFTTHEVLFECKHGLACSNNTKV